MRTYGSIQTCFWENPSTENLSDQAKLLATYLLTGPHTNMIGCFRLPLGYITIDLNWDLLKVVKAKKELAETHFITYDETFELIIIHDFLKWNRVQNPKQGSSAQKLFNAVPTQSTILPLLVQALLTYSSHFKCDFLKHLKELATSYGYCSDTVSDKQEQEQNQEQEQDQNQEQLSSLREEVISDSQSTSKSPLHCPHEEIIKLYHETLPMCPPIRIWNKTRRSYLKQRWLDDPKHQDLDWWKKYFEYVKKSNFLTGKIDGRDGKPTFVVDLEWLVRASSFAKIIEGKYHRDRS